MVVSSPAFYFHVSAPEIYRAIAAMRSGTSASGGTLELYDLLKCPLAMW
jgi:hypothetical protein